MPSDRMNVLVIMSDEHSARWCGYAGCDQTLTPNLDALAARSAVFSNCYCNVPLCAPSRRSMLTGRLPSRIGAWDNRTLFPANEPTLAHQFAAGGYDTALIGRMHFIGPDPMHGFANRWIGEKALDPDRFILTQPCMRSVDWRQSPPKTLGKVREELSKAGPIGPDETFPGHVHDALVEDKTIELLRRQTETDEPFFMLTSLFRPHYPLRAEADLFEEALARTAEPDTAPGPDAMHPVNRQILRHYGLEEVSPETARRARAAYFAMIAELDRRIGNIMNTLEETGLAENTIVVYTSDHGDMAGEHGLFFKVTLYDESSKVPLLIRVPGQAPRRIDEPASLVDLMPTLSDLCGLPLETVTDGHSLAAGITGGDPGRDEPVICEFYGEALRGPIRMLRQGRYKLNWYHGYGPELFDLEADPRERSNLAEDPDHADVLDRLRQRLFDGWDPEAMRRRVLSDQHDMALIDAARRRTRKAGGFRANGQPLPHLPDQTEPTF